jgi:hypothetical protein
VVDRQQGDTAEKVQKGEPGKVNHLPSAGTSGVAVSLKSVCKDMLKLSQ